MNLSLKEVALCVGGGLLLSVAAFVVTFFLRPVLLTNEGFLAAVGLLPMVLFVGLRLNHNERNAGGKDR